MREVIDADRRELQGSPAGQGKQPKEKQSRDGQRQRAGFTAKPLETQAASCKLKHFTKEFPFFR